MPSALPLRSNPVRRREFARHQLFDDYERIQLLSIPLEMEDAGARMQCPALINQRQRKARTKQVRGALRALLRVK